MTGELMPHATVGALSAYLRDVDSAVEILKEFFASADVFWVSHAKVDPDFDPVRDDPRFTAMIAATEARLAAKATPEGANKNDT